MRITTWLRLQDEAWVGNESGWVELGQDRGGAPHGGPAGCRGARGMGRAVHRFTSGPRNMLQNHMLLSTLMSIMIMIMMIIEMRAS